MKKSFEDQVEEIIKDYGAPENIADEIKGFLIDSGNVYSIVGVTDESIKPGEFLEDGKTLSAKHINSTFICSKCKATINICSGKTVCDKCHTIYNIIPNTYIISSYNK